MRKLLTKTIFAVLVSMAASTGVMAQDPDRVWENGSVWTVSYIETHPGQFNAYIKDLGNVWRRYLEEQKKDGDVLSYKMISLTAPRDGEPDLMLLVEFKNWATLDRSNEYFEKMASRLQGSIAAAQQSNIDREALRKLRGSVIGQEIRFKN